MVTHLARELSRMPTSEHLFDSSSTHATSVAPSTPVIPLVLLVANSAAELEACAFILNQSGVRVTTARTGFEALVKATCYVPELIVIQEGLVANEGVDGTVAQQLLRICPATAHIPVISCSTLRSMFVERDASASMAQPEKLLAAVRLQAH
jgi:PleD family two-component response regulator